MLALIALTALILGGIVGYYFMPEKTVITERIVTVTSQCEPSVIEKIVTEKVIPSSCNELRQIQQEERKSVDPELHEVNYSRIEKPARKQMSAGVVRLFDGCLPANRKRKIRPGGV